MKPFFEGLSRLNGSIIIVQHMPKYINGSVRKTLDSLTKMEVKIACHGENLKHGIVYIAPSEVHMTLLSNKTIQLIDSPKVCHVRPSVDVTMKSVEQTTGDNIIGIIMTGMGKDGAVGISHIKSIGGSTYAQDEETSVIWGMPKAAIGTGHIDHVLSSDDIRNKLISLLGS